MLERVPTIPTSQEMMDQAFGKAAKIEVPDPEKYHRLRKTLASRMESVGDKTVTKLRRIHYAFPNLEHVGGYEQEILDILVGLPKLRKALGSVKWAADTIERVVQTELTKMQRVRTIDGFHQAQKRVYGRVASIIKELGPSLDVLADARDRMRVLPTVDPRYATVVIAGFPNVGKSSLLAAMTNAKPEVAGYAFTTKKSNVGHMETSNQWGEPVMVQLVDTPGLLDRPDNKRNDVERQAIAALRHAADAVLFIIDPSETSGFTVGQQEALLEQTRKEMAGIPLLVVESKADLLRTGTDGRVAFSNQNGEGLEELRKAVAGFVPDEDDLADDPLEKWNEEEEDDDW